MITLFLQIIETSILPLFFLILGGFIMDKSFKLDVYTLSKLNFYILLPIYIFNALYTAKLSDGSIIISCCAIIVLTLSGILSAYVGKFVGFSQPKIQIFKNSIMFNNGGNIGVAIVTFVYSNPPFLVNGTTPYLNAAIVAVISLVIIQNVTSNTLGFYQAGQGKLRASDCFKLILHMPSIYVVPTALLCKLLPFSLVATPLWPALKFFSNGFVPIAMIILGTQIHRTPLNFFKLDVLLAAFMRLIIGPCIAIVAIYVLSKHIFPISAIAAQAIVITYAVPSAVNSALIALEMKNHPEYATQIVMATTFLSAFTMPLFILGSYYLYPL